MNVFITTGAIGSGKSTAVGIINHTLEEQGRDTLRLHLDDFARDLIAKDEAILTELKDTFGPYVVNIEGELNRQALATAAFKSPETVAELNQITHPKIMEHLSEVIDEYLGREPEGLVLMESPYPFGLEKYDPTVLYIYAPFEVRAEHNESFPATDFEARDRVQPTEESYRSSSDFEIENTFYKPTFEAALHAFVKEYI